jgi:hypothetical protein
MRKQLAIALTVLLAGCATAGSDGLLCQALVPYPPEVQRRAADELAVLPPDSALARMIDDYGELRARIRGACGHAAGRSRT